MCGLKDRGLNVLILGDAVVWMLVSYVVYGTIYISKANKPTTEKATTMSIQITSDEAESMERATKLVTGNGKGVASVEATVTDVKVISEFKPSDSDDCSTDVDTEVVAVVDLVIHYTEGFYISLTGAFTNHVMQKEVCTLRDIKDEFQYASMFFDLNHKVVCNERNKSGYAYSDVNDDKHYEILIGAEELLNQEYKAFTPYGVLERSLNGQGEHKDLLDKEQHKQLDKTIREQVLKLLNNQFV